MFNLHFKPQYDVRRGRLELGHAVSKSVEHDVRTAAAAGDCDASQSSGRTRRSTYVEAKQQAACSASRLGRRVELARREAARTAATTQCSNALRVCAMHDLHWAFRSAWLSQSTATIDCEVVVGGGRPAR